MKTKLFYTILAAPLLIISCQNKIANIGSGSTTETATVTAMLHNPGGSPAKNATVYFTPGDSQPSTSTDKSTVTIDSAKTNQDGNYTIKLKPGNYTLSAKGDSGIAFRDSIIAVKDSIVFQRADTLRPAGTLSGRIELQPGDDARTVFILFMGTKTFVVPSDSVGNFVTGPMAGSQYRVRILTTLDNYYVMDTNLVIKSGKNTALLQSIVLKFKGIPVPRNVKLVYDTLPEIVTLTWSKDDTSLVKGYNVYKRNIDSGFGTAPINGTTLIKDTVFRDTNVIELQSYEYKIVAVDKGDNAGKFSAGNSVFIASAFKYVGFFGDSGSGVGKYQKPLNIFTNNSGKIFISDNYQKVLVYDASGTFLTEYKTPNYCYGISNSNKLYISSPVEDSGYLAVMDTLGNILSYFAGKDSGYEELYFGLAISPENDLYVPYLLQNRIAIFDPSGNFKREINNVTGPGSLTFISNNKFAVATSNSCIKILDTAGTLINQISGSGIYGSNIATTKENNLVVLSGQIAIYSLTGKLLARFGHDGTDSTSLGASSCVCDNSGHIILVDRISNKVKIFKLPSGL
jgi:hypothetical protein